jgi:hypothetical protein
MNRENVLKAIAVMERAKARGSVRMNHWQSNVNGLGCFVNYAEKESELHACGNMACFAGHIAVSTEFQEDGGSVGVAGYPIFGGYECERAIAEWLGISWDLARGLVHGGGSGSSYSYAEFYQKNWMEVTADDVLAKLHMILNGELT